MPIRVLHIADSHIGAELPQRPRTRTVRRGDDFVESYRRALARAREFDVDLVIHAGDLFDTPRPSETAIAAACTPLWELACGGCPVVIVPGNHERSMLPNVLLLAHENIHVLREPRTVVITRRGLRIAVAGFPYLRRGAAGQFADAVAASGWRQARGDVNILAVHQAFDGARCGPADFQFRGGDDVVPRSAVPTGFDYVAAGHIHRHQVLAGGEDGGTPIVYAGSPDRIAFAEQGEPKGCVVVELDGGNACVRFCEHEVRPMEIIPIDVTGHDGPAVAGLVSERVARAAARSVVMVRLSGQAASASLRGLRLTEQIRSQRPDLLATVSSQAIEWTKGPRLVSPAARSWKSAFAAVDSYPVETVVATPEGLREVPDACGTYALYDAGGRLLYIGKALKVRTRVRSHLRGSSGGGFFANWAQQVARVELRPAGSELEALLVEADLIRRLCPAFNRQMRQWRRYCYLAVNGCRPAQLKVSLDLRHGEQAFGPWRGKTQALAVANAVAGYFGTAHCPEEGEDEQPLLLPEVSPGHLCERYFGGRCGGPCGGRVSSEAYQAALRGQAAFLAAEDDAAVEPLLVELREFEAREGGQWRAGLTDAERMLCTLCEARARAVLLRQARSVLNALLLLPGSGGACHALTVTQRGVHVTRLERNVRDARRVLAWHRSRVGGRVVIGAALPKAAADSLCTVAQQLRRRPDICRCLDAGAVAGITPRGLLRAAFVASGLSVSGTEGGSGDSAGAARGAV